MARRVFLHIGTPKSGTTFLQSLWWHNREALADRGLLLPGGSEHVQFHACAVIRANAGVLATMDPTELTAWDRVIEETSGWSGDVLISQEQLVETSQADATAAIARLGEVAQEVHVIVTVRDLVRQVPSAWQQRVKHGSPTTLRGFFRRVAQDDPGFNFWHHQDVPRILDRWACGLPPEHVHVVVLPRPGAARDLLWQRMCDLLGIDDAGLSLDAPVANETLAPAEVAFLRRVNSHFSNAHLDVAQSRRIKGFMQPRLGREPVSALALAPDMHGWLAERGGRMVDELANGPWHLVGDVEDLRPDPEPGEGVDPDALPDAEVLAVAESFIAAELLARAARSDRPVPPGLPASVGGRLVRRVRGALRRLIRR